MRKRKAMTKKASRRSFKKGTGTHKKNTLSGVMRGGIRM